MNDDVRVLLVGGGRAGLVHGRNFARGVRGARLVGVADPVEDAARRAAKELAVDRVETDPVRAVTADDVDAVVITSPTFTHADLAVAALDAGKHVLSEKPLAADLDDAGRIAAAARRSAARFVMAFMRRFDPRFARAAERIGAGDIGTPLLVKSTGRGPGLPPEWAWDTGRSGGLIAEVNSHDLDTLRFLSRQEFETVHCLGRAAKRPDIAETHTGFVDLLVATFEMTGGVLGAVDGACPADYGYDARAEVYGSEGVMQIGSSLADAPLVVRDKQGLTDAVTTWRELFADGYRAEDEHFVRVARGDEPPRVTVDDGLRAVEAVVATNRSIASDGDTVRVDGVAVA
jgi:myo-inositol 2-dehydrogenase/D-chiro-inositol 1-dehydrogenase/scyllo-inositol 2-dehydrogenase (NAD+)